MQGTIDRAVDELHDLLAGDQLRFELVETDMGAGQLRMRLNLDAVECTDCIMPADYLTQLVTGIMRESLDQPGLVVTIDDPRSA